MMADSTLAEQLRQADYERWKSLHESISQLRIVVENVRVNQERLSEKVAEGSGENRAQHAELGAELARVVAQQKANNEVLIAQYVAALSMINEKLIDRNIVIRTLFGIVLVMIGYLAGAKWHLDQLLKIWGIG